jgi:hypothetical protein
MVNTTFVTDAQLNVWIDESLAELWDLLSRADPDRYLMAPYSIATTASGSKPYAYALPADFYQARGVDLVIGNDRYPLERVDFLDRERFSTASSLAMPPYGTLVRYRIERSAADGSGARIVFDPDPGTNTYNLHYVQAPQLLGSDVATFDGVAGWEMWIVYDVAAKALAKEESDASFCLAQRARIEERIKHSGRQRDAASPTKIQDTYRPGGIMPRRW